MLYDIGKELCVVHTASSGVTESEFRKLISLNKPVIFRGYAESYDCVTKWSLLEYLTSASHHEEQILPQRKYQVF